MKLGDFAWNQPDAVNDRIWRDSPGIQSEIPPVFGAAGTVGCQQSMLCHSSGERLSPLSWVPDLITNAACGPVSSGQFEPGTALVIGSAYSPFAGEGVGRKRTLPVARYAEAGNWWEFQRTFVEHVVEKDEDYYDKIDLLLPAGLFGPGGRKFVLTDLCKGAFCLRRKGEARRQFYGGDGIVSGKAANLGGLRDEAPNLFLRYCRESFPWVWSRILNGGIRRVLVLGWLAETVFLRAIHSFVRGSEYKIRATDGFVFGGEIEWDNFDWMRKRGSYARQPLGCWIARPRSWWEVSGRQLETPVRVLPVYHPSSTDSNDRNYLKTREALSEFL